VELAQNIELLLRFHALGVTVMPRPRHMVMIARTIARLCKDE